MPRRRLAQAVRDLGFVGPVSRALTQSPSSSSSASAPVSPEDSIYFDTFRNATVPSTCALFPSTFWRQTVLQLAHENPAMWHATIAIGVLQQRMEALASGSISMNERALRRRAEKHYGRALALSKDLRSTLQIASLSTTLVTAASLLGRYSEMQRHIMSSLDVVARERERTPSLYAVEQTLMRLDMHAMTFSDSSSPYPYEQSEAAFPVQHFLTLPYIEGTSYEELGSELFALFRAYMIVGDGLLEGNLPHGPLITKMDGFRRRLAHWESRISEFEKNHLPIPEDEVSRLSIRLWHVILRIFVRASSVGLETRFDELMGHFEHSVRLAAAILQRSQGKRTTSVSLEPGLIVPMWMTIHRCRHYWLRHAALDILGAYDSRDGMWQSRQATAVLKTLVSTEEEFMENAMPMASVPPWLASPPLEIPWNAWSKPDLHLPTTVSWSNVPTVPEENRVQNLIALVSGDQSSVEIGLLMCKDPFAETDEPGAVRKFNIHF